MAALTLFAIATVAPASAATEPEYGRCVKVATPKTGVYANTACTTSEGKKAHEYEWIPTEHLGITLATKSKIVMKIAGIGKLECASAHGFEEIVSPTRAAITQHNLTLEGCHVGAAECHNGAAGVVTNNEGLDDRLFETSEPEEGIGTRFSDLGAGDFEDFEFGCPANKALSSAFIDGDLAGFPQVGKMRTSETVKYKAPKGVQAGGSSFQFCRFEIGCTPIAVTMTLVRTYEEAVEIRPPV